jgi:site-specific DNA-methyltransferase (adenine-specific)
MTPLLNTRRRWEVKSADCLDALPKLPADSIDAIITDPPYGLEFMGAHWDRIGDVGQASHSGFAAHSAFKGFRLPSYSASAVRGVEGKRMQEWHETWAREALRVLAPGGHLLAFGGTRTFHRLTSALEGARFLGIEREAAYVPVARARIKHWAKSAPGPSQ